MDYKLELDVCDPFLPVEQLINTRLEIRKFVAKYKKITSPVILLRLCISIQILMLGFCG